MSYNAEVVADSVCPEGVRLTTMLVNIPTCFLAQFNWPVWLVVGVVFLVWCYINEARSEYADSKPAKIPGAWDRQW